MGRFVDALLLVGVFSLVPVGLLLVFLSFYSSVWPAVAERWVGLLLVFVGVLLDGLFIYTRSQ